MRSHGGWVPDARAVEALEERCDPTYYRLVKSFMRGTVRGQRQRARGSAVHTDRVQEVAACLKGDRRSRYGADPLARRRTTRQNASTLSSITLRRRSRDSYVSIAE